MSRCFPGSAIITAPTLARFPPPSPLSLSESASLLADSSQVLSHSDRIEMHIGPKWPTRQKYPGQQFPERSPTIYYTQQCVFVITDSPPRPCLSHLETVITSRIPRPSLTLITPSPISVLVLVFALTPPSNWSHHATSTSYLCSLKSMRWEDRKGLLLTDYLFQNLMV